VLCLSLCLVLCLYIYVDLKMLEFLCCSWCWSGYIYIYVLLSDVPIHYLSQIHLHKALLMLI
jgi:hypothetical protein